MPIWTDAYLNQLLDDAGGDITATVPCLYHRFFLTTVAGTSVYTLPQKCKSILRVTWRGIKLEPMSWDEFVMLTPGTAVVDSGNRVESSQGRPYFYVLHPTNVHDIRFHPTPSETFTDTTADPYSPAVDSHCIISCWREIDDTDTLATLPTYIDRRTRKAYAAWRAFEKEGKGQSSKAASYYKKKYTFLLDMFKKINEGVFVSKKYAMQSDLEIQGLNMAKPVLPSNYERVRFR